MISLFVDKNTGSPAGELNRFDWLAAYRQIVLPALLLLLTNLLAFVGNLQPNTIVVRGADFTALVGLLSTFLIRLIIQKASNNT